MQNKTILLILLCIGMLYSCSSQKKIINNDDLCGFDNKILPEERKMSLSKKQDSLFLHTSVLEIINNRLTEKILFKHPTHGTITSKQTNKQTNIEKSLVYKNGKLIGSFFSYIKGGVDIGKETHYDTQGVITKVIDHRQADRYPICYKEAMAIVAKRMAKKDTIFSVKRDKNILKSNDTLYAWRVGVEEYIGKSRYKPYIYKVNAKTGAIIYKNEIKITH